MENQGYGDKEEISLSSLNLLLGNVKNFYFALLDKGWALPAFTKNAITFQYLWDIFTQKSFRIQRSELKKGVLFRKVSKKYLFEELNRVIQNLGFTSEKLPDKEWMVDLLFTVDPKNNIFLKGGNQIEDPKISVPLKYSFISSYILSYLLQ
jgi:hypothetical protein